MKTIKIITTLLFLLTLSISCENNLELEPEQSLLPGQVISNAENLQSLLIGAYDSASGDNSYGGVISITSELLGADEELFWNGTFTDPGDMIGKTITPSNGLVEGIWMNAYAVINQVNIVLENLENIEDPDMRSTIEGECKFLRAVMYFDLARFFGQPYEAGQSNAQLAVPIVEKAIIEPSEITFPTRNSVSEVYALVITDLTEAYALLQDSNGEFADKYAAQALLARVYLQQGDFVGARDAAHDVLENSGHFLTVFFAEAFNNDSDSDEDVFAWQFTSQDVAGSTNQMNLYWASEEFGGRSGNPDISIEGSHFAIYDDENDERSGFFYEAAGVATLKWISQSTNIPFLRIAEMHLIRAESNFRENTRIGLAPEDEINILRARSSAGPLSGITLTDILEERKRELSFEGFILHDIKRNQGMVGGLNYDDERLVLPIPQRETDVNPNLK